MKTIAKLICCSLFLAWAHSAPAQAQGNKDAAEATRQKSKSSLTVKRDRKTIEQRLENKGKQTKKRETEAKAHKAPAP